MNRRDSLKHLLAASGALVALPSWAEGWTSENISHLSSFAATEQETLSVVVDTIIPEGSNGMGGLSVGVDKFLLKLIENCYEKDVQDNVRNELKALGEKNFSTLSKPEREALLLQSEKEFFKLIKSETIRGFNTSKEVMQYLKYKVAPGHFYGCVDVKA